MCGVPISEDEQKDAELSNEDSFDWMGHTFYVKTVKKIRTDEDRPLCNSCWKRFIRMFVSP
jgi:hypothetical protein